MLNRFNIVNDKSCSNFNLSYWPERQSYLFQHRKRQVLLLYPLRFTFALLRYLRCADLIVALLLCCLSPFGAYRKRQVLLQLFDRPPNGIRPNKFQYRKRQVLLLYHLRFTFASLRYLRCVDLIVALLLCCPTPCGAYRERQVLLPYHLCFTLALLRYLRCADLIAALLLCCLAPFGAYRKRQVLLQR